MKKSIKLIFNILYFLGAAITLCLLILSIWGPNEVIHPDSMLPTTWKEQAFLYLALGALPMLLACVAVYTVNDLKNSVHKKRNFTILFLPGFICLACALFVMGVLFLGMMNSALHLF